MKIAKHIGVAVPFLIPLGYMFVYEVNTNCEEFRTYSFNTSKDQLQSLLTTLGHEVDISMTFGIGLLAGIGALLLTSRDNNNAAPYSLVLVGSIGISGVVTALYLSYFSLRSEIPEIESGRLSICIFEILSSHVALWILLGAGSVIVMVYIRVRQSLA